ncbi:acylphosphatase [Candidatus Sumerlaeota bacterium]|nr:acylphosphatase [Candidatus Sumerlaeota bacterium]
MTDQTQSSSLHAIVQGRVQGVGFRHFVYKRASELGLAGWVRNLPDGSVEVLAGGERPILEKLEAELWKGPMFAKVREVKNDWDGQAVPSGSFQVAH